MNIWNIIVFVTITISTHTGKITAGFVFGIAVLIFFDFQSRENVETFHEHSKLAQKKCLF